MFGWQPFTSVFPQTFNIKSLFHHLINLFILNETDQLVTNLIAVYDKKTELHNFIDIILGHLLSSLLTEFFCMEEEIFEVLLNSGFTKSEKSVLSKKWTIECYTCWQTQKHCK